MKRLVLAVCVAGCLPYPDPRPSKLEKHMRSQLGGKAKIKHHDKDSSFGVAYTAHRKEEMEFELDAKGNLTRTSFAIPEAALPAAVLATVPAKKFFGAEIVFEHGTVTFWLDGDDEHWIVDANGKIVDYTFEGDEDCGEPDSC